MDYMKLAIDEAKKAEKNGEVPIGAVIVRGDKVISKAHNMREKKRNALAHAEVLAIDKACRRRKSWRLDDCVMYVTLEPCQMCMGAALNARLKKVVCGAKSETDLNWKNDVEFDMRAECSQILKDYFKGKRSKEK